MPTTRKRADGATGADRATGADGATGAGDATARDEVDGPGRAVMALPEEGSPALTGDVDSGWIEADAVEIRQGAARRVDATTVDVSQGAIGAARAERITVQMGAVGAALARDVEIHQGGANAVLAQRATLDQGVVQTIVAQQVEVRRPSVVVFLIAQRVTGEVRAIFDWRGALAFGAAFAVLNRILRGPRRGR